MLLLEARFADSDFYFSYKYASFFVFIPNRSFSKHNRFYFKTINNLFKYYGFLEWSFENYRFIFLLKTIVIYERKMNQYNFLFDLIFDESVFLTIYYYLQRYKYYKKILYESNCMNWEWFRVRGDLQGNLLTRELVFNCHFSPNFYSTLA